MMRFVLLSVAAVSLLAAGTVDEKTFANLEWRLIGPANMGGRTTDVEAVPGKPDIVYAGTGGSGLWKSVNGGITWKPLWEREGSFSVGDLALDPKNPDVIWLGAGESNLRNSVSFGDGVYKSTDGGKTWVNLGLKDTRHISRIVVNPIDTNIVYVGAFGHAFGPNEERGVFMTTDGGKTWQKTLYLDASHGVSDLDIDPKNPNVLYAAMWKFERKPWTHTSGSEQGGVFRSTDGGHTWTKLTKGLPKLMGRIGVKVAPSKPNVVYVIAESKEGILFRSDDQGETFTEVSRKREIVSRGFYYADMRVDPTNENKLFFLATSLYRSIDGGKTSTEISTKTHSDYHSLWIDPQNPSIMWQGQDGGVAISRDGGDNWQYANNFPIGQFYQISVDNRQPFYYIHGGLQDNGSWTGPSRTREPAGILNDDWRMVSFGDGFHIINHPDNPDLYLSESQAGHIVRMDMSSREQQSISPQPKSGSGGAASFLKYRFNWNTPIVASPHEKNTVFFGSNVLFQSRDFGKSWESISPDLTTNNPEKLKPAGGPVWFDNSSAEYHGTIISIAESPTKAGVIWVGTDDGNVQVTTNSGKTWQNVAAATGVPAGSPVTAVEISRQSPDTAFVAFDRHMFDDPSALIYRTTDGGKSWKKISNGLPANAYVHTLKEDPKNPSLLYAGTELGLFATWNGGDTWISLGLKNLPKVAVHDIVLHPRDNDLILATHGRSVVVFDDASIIQKMKPEMLDNDVHLFEVRPALRFTSRFTRYGIGNGVYTGPNPPYGALISLWLKSKLDDKAETKLEVLNAAGKVVRTIEKLPKDAGLHRIVWDLRYDAAKQRRPPSAAEIEFGDNSRGPQALPGTYTLKLTINGKSYTQPVEVKLDPTISVSSADLKLQHDQTIALRDMANGLMEPLKLIDSIRDQLGHDEALIKSRKPELIKDLDKLAKDYRKQLEETERKLGRPADALRLETGPGLYEDVRDLMSSIDSVNAAPTGPQQALFIELSGLYKTRVDEVKRWLSDTTPKWSAELQKLGLPSLI